MVVDHYIFFQPSSLFVTNFVAFIDISIRKDLER